VGKLGNITFACADPGRMATFWAAALDYVVQEAPPPIAAMIERGEIDPNLAAAAVDPEKRGPRLFFEKKDKSATTSLPIHLDVSAPNHDQEAEVARLVALGATVVERKTRTLGPFEESWVVMKDPEGNGFCVQ